MKKVDLLDAFIKNANINLRGITIIKSENEEEYISYKSIYEKSCKYLNYLQSKGVGLGNELIFQVDDLESYICIFWACQLGGITAVPIDIGENEENEKKILRIWKNLNSPYLLSNNEVFSNLNKYKDNSSYYEYLDKIKNKFIIFNEYEFESMNIEINNNFNKNYIALIQFSSGSTGIPKGIPIRYENLSNHVNALAEAEKVEQNDITLNWAPLSHNLGLVSVHLVSTLIGIEQYIMKKELFVKNPVLWIDKAHEHKATMLYSPNFGYKYFIKFYDSFEGKEWDLSRVRMMFNGAEPISVELCNVFLEKMSKFGLNSNVMFPAYGCSEATSVISIPHIGDNIKSYKVDRRHLNLGEKVILSNSNNKYEYVNLIDVGFPIKNCEVRICDNDNNVLDDFTVGQLQVKGTNVIKEYYNNIQATKKSFTEDGWLNTGDLCFSSNGRLVIAGRNKEIIFVNGQNYYPYDIERIAQEIDEISAMELAACGVFNDELQTDEICIFVEYNKELDKFIELIEKIKSYISEKLGLYVSNIIPIKEIEKTDSGKIQRLNLAERFLNGEFRKIVLEIQNTINSKNNGSNMGNKIQQDLLNIWIEVIGNKDIGINDSFFDIGGSSNLLIVMSSKIEKLYPGSISIIDIFEAPTILQLSKLIEESLQVKKQCEALLPNKLPEIFFNKNKMSSHTIESLELGVNDKGIDKMEVSLNDFLVAIYLYLIKQITKKNKVNINLLIDDKVKLLSLDMQNILEFEQLLKIVNNEISKKDDWREFTDLFTKQYSGEDIITIYDFNYREDDIELIKNRRICDMLIYYKENMINCIYNKSKLNSNIISKFMNNYIKLIQIVIEKM